MNIKDIKLNSHNPRDITPEQFAKLKKSLQEFPQMLDTRPLVIDENNVVLGGNMRLRVLQDLGFEEVPVKQVTGWTEEQKKEFIVKDNLSYGMWDWEMLANEWDAEQLEDWGLEVQGWEEEKLEAQEDNFEVPDEIQTDIQLGDVIEIDVWG
jgi:ParB-like chromosome segregation protein Spo0J